MRSVTPLIVALGLALGASSGAAKDEPGESVIAIVGGEIHTASGAVLKPAVVLVRGGRIDAVGEGVVIPGDARVIQAAGAIVTPGLVDADGVLPFADGERFGPRSGVDLRSSDAIVKDDPRLATALSQGVTAFLVTGEARGSFAGTAALVGNGAQTSVLDPDGPLVVSLSTADVAGGIWGAQRLAEVRAVLNDARERREALTRWRRDVQRYEDKRAAEPALAVERLLLPPEVLDDMARWTPERRAGWREAALKSAGREKDWTKPKDVAKPPARPGPDANLDLVLTAMSASPAAPATRRMLVRAQSDSAVAAALDLAKEFGLRLTIAGGEGLLVHAKEIARLKIPVIVDEAADTAFRSEGPLAGRAPGLVARLVAAGLRPGLGSGGAGGGSRFLRLCAAQQIGGGLDPEDALRAVTVWAAEAAGAEDRVGSLAAGRRADLVVWDGDPFAAASKPRLVMAGGVIVEGER